MTAMTSIDVSVIMPAWKSADFIERAIASVLAQQNVTFELVIVDDASPDKTGEHIMKIAEHDDRIIYDRLPENMGPSGARNRAIDLAHGKFLAVLDDDDIMAPNRLASMLAAAQTHKADIIVDNMRPVYHPKTQPGSDTFLNIPANTPARQISLKDYIDPATEKRLGQGLGYLKPLFRKATLDRLKLRYDPGLRNSEDFYLVAEMLAQNCKMILVSDAGYYYTIRDGSLSYRLSSVQAEAIVKAERDFRARYCKSFDRPTARASKRQLKQRLDYYAFAKLVDALKTRNLSQALQIPVRHTRSLPYLFRTLLAIAADKTVNRSS